MEGIPVALMEAMACKVPVIATRLSGIPELVTDGAGILVAPDDAVALADAIVRVLDDEELSASLAERGRARVVESFDLFHEAARLGDAIEHVITNREDGA